MMTEEKLIDIIAHEVRIRLIEQNMIEIKENIRDMINLLRWILGAAIVDVIIPIGLKYFNLM
jgi:hypothetical protein